MIHQLKNSNFYIIVGIDLLLFALAHVGAYVIRFDLMLIAAILAMYRFEGFSRGVFVLDWILTFVLVAGVRVVIRQGFQSNRFGAARKPGKAAPAKIHRPVLIIGAGNAGEKTLREIRDNPEMNYRVKGFIDDDATKIGRSIHDVRVLGRLDDLPVIAEKEGIVATAHEKILVIKTNGCFDGYGDQDGYRDWLMGHLEELYRVAGTYDACAIKAKMKEIVPEYEIQDAECVV